MGFLRHWEVSRAELLAALPAGAKKLGMKVGEEPFFDTVKIEVTDGALICKKATDHGINLRLYDVESVTVSLDETTTIEDIDKLLLVLNNGTEPGFKAESLADQVESNLGGFQRETPFMQQPIFNLYQSEHEMLRYLKRLENRDLSLAHSMIALGSCTMKLNATTEMLPVSWPELANLHPFVPLDQAQGYQEMFQVLFYRSSFLRFV